MSISGYIDRLDGERIEGWAIDRNDLSRRIQFDLLLEEELVGSITADNFRQDLAQANIADGCCAFSIQTPSHLSEKQIKSLKFRLTGGNLFLPFDVANPAETEQEGLWIDQVDWLDVLSRKLRSGELTPRSADLIAQFVRDGFLVIPKAVGKSTIRRLNAEIERLWLDPPEGALVETFEPDGVMKYARPEEALRAGRTKLLDIYAYSETARNAIANPATVELLTALFEEVPKVFQSLSFHRGSEQATHRDIAYVRVEPNPTAFVGVWLALEDVTEGSGEIEYYPASHRAPPYLFGGRSRWMAGHETEHESFLKKVAEYVEEKALPKETFKAKAGDVLIWHSSLSHAGSLISNHEVTRRSLLAHFTSGSNVPFYCRHAEEAKISHGGIEFVSELDRMNRSE